MTNALISFEVPGNPVPKGRPRKGKHGNVYTPDRTRAYEKAVGTVARLAMKGRPPLAGPVEFFLIVYLPTPKKPKHKFPITKTDLSNILKAAEDACNDICYGDDSQIVRLTAVKDYSSAPGIVVEISPYPREAA